MFFIQNDVSFLGGIGLRRVGVQKVVIGVFTPLHQLESEKRGWVKLCCVLYFCAIKKQIKR